MYNYNYKKNKKYNRNKKKNTTKSKSFSPILISSIFVILFLLIYTYFCFYTNDIIISCLCENNSPKLPKYAKDSLKEIICCFCKHGYKFSENYLNEIEILLAKSHKLSEVEIPLATDSHKLSEVDYLLHKTRFAGVGIENIYTRPCTSEEIKVYVDHIVALLIKNEPWMFMHFETTPELIKERLTYIFTKILPLMKEGPLGSRWYEDYTNGYLMGVIGDHGIISKSPYWNNNFHLAGSIGNSLRSGYIHHYSILQNCFVELLPNNKYADSEVIWVWDTNSYDCINYRNSVLKNNIYSSFYLSENILLNNNWSFEQIEEMSYLINDIPMLMNPALQEDLINNPDAYNNYLQNIEICKIIFKAVNS